MNRRMAEGGGLVVDLVQESLLGSESLMMRDLDLNG
jgi:hypothetical protein